MVTTIDPSAIFSGAPVSITYDGVECGATIAVPTLTIDVEAGGPDFTNAGGPVKLTRIIRKIIPSIELTVNEITAEKLGWALPGAESEVGPPAGIRPKIGRIGSAAYADLVLVDEGADGALLTVTLENAVSAETQELSFDDDPANPLGLVLKFTGTYDPDFPTKVPLILALTAATP